MHSIEELGTNVPAFLAKLWKMVEDPETNDLICWSSTGTSFFIQDQARFARELLPLYYKHNNMASFVRQLNMYGFHKVVSIESGGLKVDKNEMEFAHPCFLMGHPYLLEHIKRKIPVNKADDGRSGTKPELVNKVLNEVKNMKGRQDTLDTQLNAMKRENEVLWREVAILRQKHIKQQQIVNKLIQFLVSMVQSSRSGGIGMKRHYPLMLNDITNRPNKSPKINDEVTDNSSVPNNLSPTGPVIHELDPAELLDDCEVATEEVSNTDFLATNAEIGEVHSPASPEATNTLGDTNSDVLLELTEDYQLAPDVLISVDPAAVKDISDALKVQKPKLKQESSKMRKRKNKLSNSSKNKSVPVKKTRPADSVTLDDKEYSSGQLKAEKTLPTWKVNSPVEISLVEANDAAVSAISNAAAKEATPNLETGIINSTELAPDCNVYVVNDSLATDERPTSSRSPNGVSDMTLACTGSNVNDCSGINRQELDSHLDTMQSDLDGLKELLKGDGYSLDANTLLGLFGGDDLISYGIHVTPGSGNDEKQKDNVSDPLVSGSELMTYPSEILDFSDICQNSEDEWILPGSPDLNFANAATLDQDTAGSALSTPNPQILGTPKAIQ